MARNLFGGTAADVAEDVSGGRIPGAVGTVWDGPSDGAVQLTDLTDADGASIIQIVADSRGFIPSFYGPDNGAERVWVDFGVGKVALVSPTVGDRLISHQAASDPHQDRAYTDERLVNYIGIGGGDLNMPTGATWLGAVVPSPADLNGYVLNLKTSDGIQYTRIRNSGAIYVDTVGKYAALCIGAPAYPSTTNVINVTNSAASASSDAAIFQVKGDGSVVSKSTVTATNIGTARLFSGPTAPASPVAGDVWVQYG